VSEYKRLFFALWPDARTGAALEAAAARARTWCGGRPPRPGHIHLTLAFLGRVEAARVAELERLAGTIGAARFTLSLDRLGYWKHNRILWAGCASAPAPLRDLAAALGDRLAAAGLGGERRSFAAHLTLLRDARSAPPPDAGLHLDWPVDEIRLVESRLEPGGAVYVPLARCALL
jgi:2'-5' RNA ligase